ncbi:MAG: cohesin domain-containing protein [Candidatus Acidiferrales bacterium]
MNNRTRVTCLCALFLVVFLTAGCPKKGGADLKQGQKAELEKDYDSALIHYERALKADPRNPEYELRSKRIRFLAAQTHVDRGHKLRDQGLLEPAAAEFEKALAIDPSSFIAEQELRRTLEMIIAQRQAQSQAAPPPSAGIRALANVPEGPPELRPLSREPLNLRITEDARRIFESIGRLAGINVVFDPDFQPRRVTVELDRATLEQALDIVGLMTKTFWKPVTSNTIMVIPDSAAKRRSYEEQVLRTFYLANTVQAAELNEIVQTLRTLLDIKRITPSTTNNAIIIRDTPDKVAVAEKIIRDVDQAKPEVLVQVAVLQARRDRARELGILPSTSIPVAFTPASPTATNTNQLRLSDLQGLSSKDYSIVLPSATALMLMTDSTTQIIQNPEVRVTDGQTAKLRIGDRVPFAVGSFQPGIGGVGVNPLVNTQFQFQDVGVNVDLTPRVHSGREVSLRLKVEVSSVTGTARIGGIDQPIFGQRIIEHDIRLREGEVSVLGGIIERSETVSLEGWPGLSQVPFLRYLFSSERKTRLENEVMIVLTPRIIRLPEVTAANLRQLSIGTDENVSLPRPAGPAETAPVTPTEPRPAPPAPAPAAPRPLASAAPSPTGPAQIIFQPAESTIAAGTQFTVDVVVENAQDLFTVPLAIRFDPNVVMITEIHHGDLMGGTEQPAALVQRVDAETGTAILSVSRPPGAPGANGNGILVTLTLDARAAGQTQLVVQNVAARNSRREPLTFQTASAEIVVE